MVEQVLRPLTCGYVGHWHILGLASTPLEGLPSVHGSDQGRWLPQMWC